MSLGSRLKQARDEKGLTQKELANLSGLYQAQICRYERGDCTPPSDVLKRLANALEVSSAYLIEGTGEDAAEEQIYDRVLLRQFKKIEQMQEKDREVIKVLIEAFIAKKEIQEIVQSSI